MGAIATFNYAAFIARFPEFAGLDQALAQEYFDEASLYLANDGTGPVQNQAQQSVLMNLATAHIAQLNRTVAALGGGVSLSSGGMVGPLTSASEGSTSISTQPLGTDSGALGAWFSQTPYGLALWAALSRYRTMHYRPRAGRNFNSFPLVR